MSFSGKKFRRIGCENIEELLRASNRNENLLQTLKCNPPVFCFTKLDDQTFRFCLLVDDKCVSYHFRLGEEFEMERKDGCKVKVTFILESDNVLKQVIKKPDGKIVYFTKEFGEKESKMTITMEGTDDRAIVFYEMIE